MSGRPEKIKHPRVYRGRKMRKTPNINAIFLRKWRESRIERFYGVYREIIATEIREKKESGEWSLL